MVMISLGSQVSSMSQAGSIKMDDSPLTCHDMSVTIRPIEKKDKEEWTELWSGSDSYLVFYKSEVAPEVTETTFARFFDPQEPVYSIVAVDDSTGKLVGFANYLTHRNTWTIGDSLYLNDLFVSSRSRLKGTGRKLIEYVYAEADKLGSQKVYWLTSTDNHRAQLLYTKVGVNGGKAVYVRP